VRVNLAGNPRLQRHRASSLVREQADQDLARIASDCHAWAAQFEEPLRIVPGRAAGADELAVGIEEDARAVLDALASDQAINLKHRDAQRVLSLLLDSPLPVLRSRIPKGENTTHWAIFSMMVRLLELTAFDPKWTCRGACAPPRGAPPSWHCASLLEDTAEAQVCAWPRRCAKAVVFPYESRHAAANAVVEGFRASRIDTSLTADRVRQHYRRHFIRR